MHTLNNAQRYILKEQSRLIFVLFLLFIPVKQAVAKGNTEKAGDLLLVMLPAAAYGSAVYRHDKKGQHQFYQSLATNLGATYALKYTVNKTRPNGGKHSFPSGHTSTAFQAATFIHKRYGLHYAIPAYIGATFVGYSRVKSKQHDTTDVIAGAAIGIASSLYFTKPYKGFSLTPTANEGRYSLQISKQW